MTKKPDINRLIKLVQELVYYSQIHTVTGVISDIPHDKVWREAQQWLWNNCKIIEGEYFLKEDEEFEPLPPPQLKELITQFYPKAAEDHWDDVEVHAVWCEDGTDTCEPCDKDEDATFFSVYLHQLEGGIQCVADLPTREAAESLAELLRESVKTHTTYAKVRFEFWTKMFKPRTKEWMRDNLSRLKRGVSVFETEEENQIKIKVLQNLLND